MSRTFAIAMTRPHERLQLPLPIGRRLPQGIVGWNMVVAVTMMACIGLYIIQVNQAASRGFHLRDVEKNVDSLTTQVRALEDQVATLSSVQSMTTRAEQLGFVTVDRLEFANPASRSYAFAK